MKNPSDCIVSIIQLRKTVFSLCAIFLLVLTLCPAARAQNGGGNDPCASSQLCTSMFQVISQRKQNEMQYLIPALSGHLKGMSPEQIRTLANEYLNAQIADHISHRFGYGLSSAEMKRTFRSVSDLDLKGWLSDLAKVVESPPPFTNAELNRMGQAYSFETPLLKLPFNAIQDPIESLQELHERMRNLLELGSLCKNGKDDDTDGLIDAADPDCKYGKTDTEATGQRRTDILKDANFLRTKVRNSAAEFRTLISAFGSQRKVGDRVVDAQSNFSSVLQETMFNHFNVDYSKITLIAGMGPGGYERTIHAAMFKTFYDLLSGVIQHPAMLTYLDNQSNRFDFTTLAASNQNLGRELLELHTFGLGPDKWWRGVNGVAGKLYTQKDVENSSLLLTGLNVKASQMDGEDGFDYGSEINYLVHVPDYLKVGGVLKQTSPVVMGKRFCLFPDKILDESQACDETPKFIVNLQKSKNPEDQKRLKAIMTAQIRKQLANYLRFLANHDRTKTNICGKLVRRFVVSQYDPSGLEDDPKTFFDESRAEVQRAPVIERCVAAWGQDGDLPAMYKAILTSSQVWAASNYQKLIKNPNDLVISALRASGVVTSDFTRSAEVLALGATLVKQIDYLGLPYRRWITPTGYNELHGWLGQGYLVRWIRSSFILANYLESRSGIRGTEQYAPIMGIWIAKGLKGSLEETCRLAKEGEERYEFVRQLLGYGDIRTDSYRIKRLTGEMMSKDGSAGTGPEYRMVKQRIEDKYGASCVKAGLTSISASVRFLTK